MLVRSAKLLLTSQSVGDGLLSSTSSKLVGDFTECEISHKKRLINIEKVLTAFILDTHI